MLSAACTASQESELVFDELYASIYLDFLSYAQEPISRLVADEPWRDQGRDDRKLYRVFIAPAFQEYLVLAVERYDFKGSPSDDYLYAK